MQTGLSETLNGWTIPIRPTPESVRIAGVGVSCLASRLSRSVSDRVAEIEMLES